MAEKRGKKAAAVLGCTACWLAAVFFAFLEVAEFLWFMELLPDVIHYGYDEAAGYNLHLAEEFWEARFFMVLYGVPLIVMLALSIHLTRRLRAQATSRNARRSWRG